MKEFNSEDTKLKFKMWLGGFPESYHGLDMDRFYEFTLSLKLNEEWITKDELHSAFKEEREWGVDFRNKIVSDYYHKLLELGNFIDFIIEKKLIKKSL